MGIKPMSIYIKRLIKRHFSSIVKNQNKEVYLVYFTKIFFLMLLHLLSGIKNSTVLKPNKIYIVITQINFYDRYKLSNAEIADYDTGYKSFVDK